MEEKAFEKKDTALKPYYDRDGITIYHGDCREILPLLDLSVFDLLLTDPPYGISERTDRKSKGRGKLAECNDFLPVYGDDRPFDPSHLIALGIPKMVIWGANYFAERLPTSSSWLVWDKRDLIPSNDNADVELAWSNLGGPARKFTHIWNGMIKASERTERRVHPTQKPVELMRWCLKIAQGGAVIDPYMGSGSTLIAAKDFGLKTIGIEIEEKYCRIAVERLSQQVLPFRQDAPPPLTDESSLFEKEGNAK